MVVDWHGESPQCYNAQAIVDTETMLVMRFRRSPAGNDKTWRVTAGVGEDSGAARGPDAANASQLVLADAGYLSEANVDACRSACEAASEPLIAVKRDEHHPM